VARLLLPYCRREIEEADGPDNERGWWFTDAPPDITREALTLVIDKLPGERPNDQPPEEWLMAQAERHDGVLAGFVAPAGPASSPGAGGRGHRSVLAGRGPGRRDRAAVAR